LKSSSNRFGIQVFFHLLHVFFNSSSHLPMFRNLVTSTILRDSMVFKSSSIFFVIFTSFFQSLHYF
jgi:hypothetical protein